MIIRDIRIGNNLGEERIKFDFVPGKDFPAAYLNHPNRQSVKVQGIKNSRTYQSIVFDYEDIVATGDAWMETIEMLGDTKVQLKPIVNKFSFNPNIIMDETNALLNIDHTMIFVTIDTEKFCQLRYYTNMDVISVFQSRKNHQIGCILRYSIIDGSTEEKYFSTYGVEKETGRFREYHYSTKDCALNTTDKFQKHRLTELQEINKKYHNRPLQFKYSTKQVPAHVIAKVSDIAGLIEDIKEFYGNDVDFVPEEDLVIHKIPDGFDIHDDAVLAGMLGDELARTKAVLLGPGIELTRDRAYALNLIYLLQFDRNRSGEIILRQVQGK